MMSQALRRSGARFLAHDHQALSAGQEESGWALRAGGWETGLKVIISLHVPTQRFKA